MNQLFSIGKSLMGGSKNRGDDDGGFNPLTVFKQFDQNGDGKITEDDFVIGIEKLGLGGVGESAARIVFQQLDRNRNGKLDLSEALGAVEAVKALLAGKRGLGGGGGGGGGSSRRTDEYENDNHNAYEDEEQHHQGDEDGAGGGEGEGEESENHHEHEGEEEEE